MQSDLALTIAGFLTASSLVVMVYLLLSGRKDRVDERLEGLGDTGAPLENVFEKGATTTSAAAGRKEASPIDRWTSRRMRQVEKKQGLRDRMTQAGLYDSKATVLFVTLRLVLALSPTVLGFLAAQAGMVTMTQGLGIGVLAGLFGTLAPSFWLDHIKRARQTKIRRALPDALDVLVVCLEGGLSLSGSFSRVARELSTAHPMLAVELQIVERQTQMGRTIGEAIREFAGRFDLEELRSMASVIGQAERLGTSVVTALEVFAETLRLRRSQRAEEMAQKASVKLLFPTLLFIFPGIFVVILGPAAIQVYHVLIQGVMKDIAF